MRALLLCDDFYHPGEVPIQAITPLREKGIAFDAIKNAKDFNPETLSNYNTVIMSTCDNISQGDTTPWKTVAIQEAFIKYVENGGGLLVTHNGTVAGDNTEKLDKLIGCRFAYHPNQTHVLVQAIKPHPVTEGVRPFCQLDEFYELELLAHDVDILAAAYTPPQGQEEKYETEPYYNAPAFIAPAVYVRTQEKGRVCVITPGHNLEVWLDAQFQRLLENAIRWCGSKR